VMYTMKHAADGAKSKNDYDGRPHKNN